MSSEHVKHERIQLRSLEIKIKTFFKLLETLEKGQKRLVRMGLTKDAAFEVMAKKFEIEIGPHYFEDEANNPPVPLRKAG